MEKADKPIRRYIVKGYVSHPGWSGCAWAYSCKTVEAAERCFAKKSAASDENSNADVVLLIDRLERKVLRAVGTDDPVRAANFYGW
jgi:hypothetical protein